MKALEVQDTTLRFGGLVAVSDVSFDLRQGEILSVIGPNGAGKTSLFNVVTGLYRAQSGHINFFEKPLVRKSPSWEVVAGVVAALLIAGFFVVGINAQELWTEAIVNRYVYGESFSYKEMLSAAVYHLGALPWSWTWLPFVMTFALCLAAMRNFQLAACISPIVSATRGLSRTFQNIRLLKDSTVAENVRTVVRQGPLPSFVSCLLRLPSRNRWEQRVQVEVDRALAVVGMQQYAQSPAGSLPYGLQRRLEIARALAMHPKVLLLDEPAAGLNPSESLELLELVKKIRASGITVLLIEHDMAVVMSLSDRIIVLHHGEKIAEGSPEEVRKNPEVIHAYLGSAAAT